MRLLRALPLAAAVLLAACGGSEESEADANGDGALSNQEVVAEAADAVKPQPGQYSSKVELIEFDVPGAPAGMADQMRAAFSSGAQGGNSFCMTEAEADPKRMLQNLAESECTFSQFEVTGGTIKADMACKTAQGDARALMDGTMTPTSSDMTMTMTQSIAGAGDVKMKMRISSQRTGECS